MKKIFKLSNAGFTLIELIIYIALIAIFISGAILYGWNVVYAGESSYQQQVVAQNGRSALTRIIYEIKHAQAINSISTNSITLEKGANDTTIALNNGVVEITVDGGGPYALTSNQVFATNLSFTESSSTNGNTKNIAVSLALRQANSAASDSLASQTSVNTATELQSSFNQSRQVLFDFTNTAVSAAQTAIEGTTFQNTGNTTATLDQIGVTWSGTTGGENITAVVINGNSVWSGSSGSGSTLDISNYDLTPAAGVTDINSFTFDTQLSSGTFNFDFIFTDGSTHKSTLTVVAGSPTPSPSPSVSPSPGVSPSPVASPSPSPAPANCTAYCLLQGYSAGACRANVNQCNRNGETNLPLGNAVCTGGNNADTCCCAP